MDYLPSPKHTLRFGGGYYNRRFSPQFEYLDEDEDEFEEWEYEDVDDLEDFDEFIDTLYFYSQEAFWYVEDNFTMGNQWLANIGLRNSFFYNERLFTHFEPRLSLRYSPMPKLHISGAASRMVQYLHLIANSSLRLPNDLWIPSSPTLHPESSWQYELGIENKVNHQLSWSIDAYYKKMQNLYTYPDNEPFVDIVKGDEWVDLTRGEGTAYGIESMLKYADEKKGAMFSYTYAHTQRQYEKINKGLSYPHEFDQRHQLKLFLYQNFGKGFQWSIYSVYNSAPPQLGLMSLESQKGFVNANLHPEGLRNSARSIPYHRLDLNLSYELKTPKVQHFFKIGTYNTYNRLNVAYYLPIGGDSSASSDVIPISSIRFQPSFSYKIKF